MKRQAQKTEDDFTVRPLQIKQSLKLAVPKAASLLRGDVLVTLLMYVVRIGHERVGSPTIFVYDQGAPVEPTLS